MATATATESTEQKVAKMEEEYPTVEEEEPKSTLTKPTFIKVEELSPASVGFNLKVKVAKIKTIMNRLNLDGNRLRISEAIIGDATACVILSLRNDQINAVSEGNCLNLRNAKIDMVKSGYMRVAIDRWGLIEKVDESQIDEINEKTNMSDVEYELIPPKTNNDAGGRGGGRGRGRRRNGGGGRGGGRRGGGRGRGRNNNY